MKKLVHIADISERLINVCERYSFVYLNDLAEYGEMHNNDFTKLKNCGKKTTEEILKLLANFDENGENPLLADKLKDNNDVGYDISIVLQYIDSLKHELSVRAYNTLRSIQVKVTSRDLKSRDFFNSLNNCGKKTSKELTSLFSNIEFSNIEDYIQSNRPFLQSILCDNLSTDNVREIFIAYILAHKSKLTVRASNTILFVHNDLSNGKISPEKIFSEDYYLELKNCGQKTAEELLIFFNSYDLNGIDEISLTELSLLRDLLDNINISPDLPSILKNKYGVHTIIEMNLVSIIDLVADYIVSDKYKDIWIKVHIEKRYLSSIADKMTLSRERIRQISKTIPAQAIKVADHILAVFIKYGHTIKYNQNSSFVLEPHHDTVLPKRFIFECLSHLTDFTIIHLKRGYNSSFLLKSSIRDIINIENILEEIAMNCNVSLREDRFVSIRQLLANNLRAETLDVEKYVPIITRLLEELYDLPILDGMVCFRRTTKKKDFEYIVDVLKSAQTPLHIDVICDTLVELGIKRRGYKSENVRSHLINHPQVFINTAWSTYGLKEWEDKMNLVGGTIKKLIIKYLEQFDEPKHIYEISKYILQHRKTNQNSVWGNINLDPQNNFNVYVGGFVGLTSKVYSLSQTNFNKVSNNWFSHFKKRYLERGKSSYKIQEVSKKLAFDLNVKPIQIRAQINERIEKGQLYLCADDYLYIKTKSAKEERSQLSDSDIQELARNKETMSRLELISKCIELASINGKKISIKSAKAIIDSI